MGDAANTFDAIFECTGLGPLRRKMLDALPAKEAPVLHVVAPLHTYLSRIVSKDFASTPYPPFSESLPDTIRRCHSEFERGDLQILWDDMALWTFTVDGMAEDIRRETERVPLRQLSALAAMGARGELTPESDIDPFSVTNVEADRLSGLLAAAIPVVVFHYGHSPGKLISPNRKAGAFSNWRKAADCSSLLPAKSSGSVRTAAGTDGDRLLLPPSAHARLRRGIRPGAQNVKGPQRPGYRFRYLIEKPFAAFRGCDRPIADRSVLGDGLPAQRE